MKKMLLISALVGVAAASNAAIIYDNLPATGTYFTGGVRPNNVADDFDLAPVGSNLPYVIEGFNIGFNTNAAANLDIRVRFYQDLDFTLTGTGNLFTAPAIADLTLGNVSVSAAGSYTTGMVALGSLSFVLPAITNYANMNHGIQIEFFNAGTSTRSTAATILFQGTTPIGVGNSEDVYWRDVNGNGSIGADEARFFGGGTSAANFAMQIEGTAVPEPATMAVLGLGALAALRRRNKKA